MTGAQFRHKRKALGFTSRDAIAEALDVSSATIQRLESRRGDIPVVTALALEGIARGATVTRQQ